MNLCEWMALCANEADALVRHPVLGNVPTCQRCRDRFELVPVPAHLPCVACGAPMGRLGQVCCTCLGHDHPSHACD